MIRSIGFLHITRAMPEASKFLAAPRRTACGRGREFARRGRTRDDFLIRVSKKVWVCWDRRKKARRKALNWYFRVVENISTGDSADRVARGGGLSREAKPWVKNLLAGQGFALPEDKQFWWSVHLATFLRYARKRGSEISLDQLVADYLAGVRLEQPPWPEWRLEQVRLALEVFVRGIEHWH